MLLGAAILAFGILVGRFMPARRRTPKLVPPPKPICGCTHHHSYHDPETARCHGLMKGEPVRYNASAVPTAYSKVPCTCRQYSGPVPLSEVYAPEITNG
jgi:hypothetical protein